MNKQGDLADLIVILLVIVIGGAIATALFGVSLGNGASGTAIDTIARVSFGGWVWQTWRVELTNDHPVASDGSVIPQRYGVDNNQALIAELQHYAETGEKVKLHYRGNLFVFNWEYSDAEVIYAVEPIKNAT